MKAANFWLYCILGPVLFLRFTFANGGRDCHFAAVYIQEIDHTLQVEVAGHMFGSCLYLNKTNNE